MTEQQIIETLATKVMGWGTHTDVDGNEYWVINGRWFTKKYWNPFQSIADAWMIMDKMALDNNMKFHDIMSKWGIFGITPKTISLSAYEAVVGYSPTLTQR